MAGWDFCGLPCGFVGQVLAGKVLFFCLERDPGLSGSVDFFSDFFCLVTTLGLGAWSHSQI